MHRSYVTIYSSKCIHRNASKNRPAERKQEASAYSEQKGLPIRILRAQLCAERAGNHSLPCALDEKGSRRFKDSTSSVSDNLSHRTATVQLVAFLPFPKRSTRTELSPKKLSLVKGVTTGLYNAQARSVAVPKRRFYITSTFRHFRTGTRMQFSDSTWLTTEAVEVNSGETIRPQNVSTSGVFTPSAERHMTGTPRCPLYRELIELGLRKPSGFFFRTNW